MKLRKFMLLVLIILFLEHSQPLSSLPEIYMLQILVNSCSPPQLFFGQSTEIYFNLCKLARLPFNRLSPLGSPSLRRSKAHRYLGASHLSACSHQNQQQICSCWSRQAKPGQRSLAPWLCRTAGFHEVLDCCED